MENKGLYNLIAKMALEFRLSLDNICKLLGKEINDESKMEVYDLIMSTVDSPSLKTAYTYLFNYETINENRISSSLALSKAVIYLKRYTKAQKENNLDELKLLKKELLRTDDDFKRIKNRDFKIPLSEEETLIECRYRVKYCISRLEMAKVVGITHTVLLQHEKRVQDARLKEKLNLVSEFYQDVTKHPYKKTK